MTCNRNSADDQLLASVKSGEPGAFRALVEAHQLKVINICYRFVQDRPEAQDLAQETFVEVHQSISGFRSQSSLSTWIHQIAVRKCLDYLRRQSRQKRGGPLKRLLRFDSEATEVPSPASVQPDVQLEQKERRRVLREALDKLPRNQRVAFVMSKYDGMSYQEIAGILKTNLSAVESLIHRAKKNLQKHLRKHYGRI